MSALPPRASIVIVTYGQRAKTEACLLSLAAALGDELGRSTEVIVVDNHSPDDTLALLREWEDRITVLAQGENHNFAGGCNIGARAARGEVLIFLNNDTIVEAGALEALAETVREDGVGAAGLRLLYPDGSLQHAGFHMVDLPGLEHPLPHHLLYRSDGAHPAGRATYEMDCVTGACLALPRAVFEEVGSFDEEFVNGCEDVDLCFKVRASGRTIVYRGDLTVEHHEGATRGTSEVDDRGNMALLHARWGAMMEQDDELAARVWDGVLGEPRELRALPPRGIVVAGDITGIGPAADEARGLLLALERAGRPAVGVDLTPNRLRARLSGDLGAATFEAFLRQVPATPDLRIDVPYGPAWAELAPAGAVLRTRACGPLGDVAPAIDFRAAVGEGGGGVLVSLPGHDHSESAVLLSALADAELNGVAVRLVPTVVGRGLEALVAERLPAAELLGPISDEAAWIDLAGSADVAVCLDADDLFDRRALGAAGAGASIIVADPDGPAAAVLGDAAVVASPATLVATLAALLPQAAARRELVAAPVREACAPDRVGHAVLARLAQPALSAA